MCGTKCRTACVSESSTASSVACSKECVSECSTACSTACCRDALYPTAAGPGSPLGRSVPQLSLGVRNDWLRGEGGNQRFVGGDFGEVGGAVLWKGRKLRFGCAGAELFLPDFI